MIQNNKNLVIICGMAHTGTTVLAHILRQHPELTLFKNGSEAFILENDILLNADTKALKEILKLNQRTILKRPWVETNQKNWLTKFLPKSYYIYCIKDKEKTIESWSSETSFVSDEFRNLSYKKKSEAFDNCFNDAIELKKTVKNFLTVNNEEVIKSPQETFLNINYYLNVSDFEYNLSDVSRKKSIKKKLSSSAKKLNFHSLWNKLFS